MNHAVHQIKHEKKWKKVNVWSIKGPLFLIALLLGVFREPLHLRGALVPAGIAVVIPIIGYRAYWGDVKFWITVALLGILQVPIVICVSPLIEE